MYEKQPPQNIQAERGVIGSCFLDGFNVLDEVRQIVDIEDFFTEKHRMIFAGIIDMQHKKVPITDITMVIDFLGGKITYPDLIDIINSVTNSKNATHYALIVKEKSVARQKILQCHDLLDKLYEGAENVNDLLSQSMLFDSKLSNSEKNSGVAHIKNLLMSLYDELEVRLEHKGIIGISSGFSDLDKYTGGFRNGNMYIIGARPKMGKTSLAIQLARNVAGNGIPVLIKSLEMTKEQLAEKFFSMEAHIDGNKLQNTSLMVDSDWPKAAHALGILSDMGIYIDDKPGKASDFNITLRREKATKNIGFTIIDYLQRFRPEGNRRSSYEQVSDISNIICDMAKEVNIPVLALSQLSRDVEKRNDKTPTAADLRESGALEQDAAMVALMYREDYYFPDKFPKHNDPSKVNLIIPLNRFGPSGGVDLMFHKAITRFAQIATTNQPPLISQSSKGRELYD
jgi:replicative DNA helicase